MRQSILVPGILLGAALQLLSTGCGDNSNSGDDGDPQGSGGSSGDGDGSGDGSGDGDGSSDGDGSGGDGDSGDGDDSTPGDNALAGSCPDGFTAAEGVNRDFQSDGVSRRFDVLLPGDTSSLRPVFISLTGTEQPEPEFASQSGLDQLVDSGWIVVLPWRRCSNEMRNCNGGGAMGTADGRVWEPWYERGPSPSDDEGPDVRFLRAMVTCMAGTWMVDADRIYFGGISAGGTFSNRLLTYASDFFAGGIPASGNWDAAVRPRTATEMATSIVIQMWGGATDVWPLDDPIVAYDDDTKAAAEFYTAQPNVVTISCSGDHGHAWPANLNLGPPFAGRTLALGNEFTLWAAETLLSFPKGSKPADFVMTTAPPDFRCVLGEYTDH